jgi:NAD(P)-dependent dehydrogenase (short-subunit alcohol dehydrogenase family)
VAKQAEGIALVTGAGRGLGRAIALELARRGFEVVATLRDPARGAALAEQARREALRLRLEPLDVTRPETIRIPDGLRVLVNNAGVEGAWLPVEEAPLSLWREIFEANLFGLVEVTRRAIPSLRASGGGVVCNVTSCSIRAPMPFLAAYRASKAAVSALGESLCTELAPFGIRVLEIQPGAIATDMLATIASPPEAVRSRVYEPMAWRVHERRAPQAAAGTPPERAAAAIADAILEHGGPLRRTCDPMGAALIEAWRAGGDESLLRGMLALFAGEAADEGR